MKVIDAIWFTDVEGVVGVVVAEDPLTTERSAYIGIGTGFDERVDTEHIIDWGGKLSLDTLQKVMGQLEKKT